MTPQEKAIRAKIAALSRTAQPGYCGTKATEVARDRYWRSLENQVDPDGRLDPEERRARAKNLFQANMLRGKLSASRDRAKG